MYPGTFSGIVTPPGKVTGSKELDSDSLGGPVVNTPHPHTPPVLRTPGLIPGLGKFHMPWSNFARVLQLRKPSHHRAGARQQRSHCSDKPKLIRVRLGSGPCSLQLEKAKQ